MKDNPIIPRRALSIRQPWAWAIIHAGKDIENRDWSPRYPALHEARRLIESRERFLIHAGLGMTSDEYEDFIYTAHQISLRHRFPRGLTVPAMAELPRGGFVGSAVLTGFVDDDPSPWFVGPMGLALAEVRALPFMPCKGALGFFTVPTEIMDALPESEAA